MKYERSRCMKKVILSFVMFLSFFILSSCDIYYDTKKRDLELINVEIYSLDNQLLETTIMNSIELYYACESILSQKYLSKGQIKLNSAAPVFRYVVLEEAKEEQYRIVYHFKSINNIEISSLQIRNYINENGYTEEEITSIVNNDGDISVEYLFNKEDTIDFFGQSVHRYTKKDGSTQIFGSVGGNEYLSGFFIFYTDINNN